MLKRLYANKKSFREIRFHENTLNIIIAEKHKNATSTASRNGLGKTTFVNIICFCLGMNVDLKSELPASELTGWEWTLELSIKNRELAITRGIDAPNQVRVKGDLSDCPYQGLPDAANENVRCYEDRDLKNVLFWCFFGLPPDDRGKDAIEARLPEYQLLMSHFIRQCFDDPVRVSWTDSWVNSEFAVTYLLGLDWLYLAEAKILRSKDRDADETINGAKSRMSEWTNNKDALEAECKKLDNDIRAAESGLKKLDSIPHAMLLDGAISKITTQLNKIEKQIIKKKRLLASARNSKKVQYIPFEPVEQFYNQLGLTFTQGARHTYEEVREFHETLTGNRGELLEEHIRTLQGEIEALSCEFRTLNNEKARLCTALEAKSALEEYTERMTTLAKFKEEYAIKQDCLAQLKKGEDEKARTDQEREELVRTATTTHQNLRAVWEKEETQFAEIINRLYSNAIPKSNVGDTKLGIEIWKENRDCGIHYQPHFWGDRSQGRNRLKALAFDLTIFLHQRSVNTIDFMIHDSVLYESADSRQCAEALSLIAKLCKDKGLQYICVMNSDDVTTDDFKSIMPEDEMKTYVIHTLSDNPDGSMTLLGEFFPRNMVALKTDSKEDKSVHNEK